MRITDVVKQLPRLARFGGALNESGDHVAAGGLDEFVVRKFVIRRDVQLAGDALIITRRVQPLDQCWEAGLDAIVFVERVVALLRREFGGRLMKIWRVVEDAVRVIMQAGVNARL